MPEYNFPEEDMPFGMGASDFPITLYDRPQHMFANLLRGDVDGVTRAMLSPDTMSPAQMKTVRDLLTKGKKVNPILKTIMDVATNPLVIMGLAVGLWKFPLGTTNSLLQLRKGLLPKTAAMNRLASGLHDAAMNLRSVPGAFETLLGITRETTKFMSKYADDANAIFLKGGKMSKAEGALIAARLDGLHKVTHPMVKTLRREPEWIAFMGGKDVPIAPGIQRTMNSKMIGVSDRLRGWFNSIRAEVSNDPEVLKKMKDAVERKGLKWGEDVADYFPHHGNYNRYYRKALRGTTGEQYRRFLHKEVATKVGREQIARTGGMFANLDDLRALESTGAIRPGFTDMVQGILDRRTAAAAGRIGQIWDDVASMNFDAAKERIAFVARVEEYYSKGGGRNLNFVNRLGNKKMARETLDAMAGALQDARFGGPAAKVKELTEIGKVLAQPAQYTLNPWDATGRYINSVSTSYAWHGTGLGDKILRIGNQPGVFSEAPWLKKYLFDDLIPHVRGLKSFPEMQRSIDFTFRKEKIHNWLKATPIVETTLGKKTKDWLLKYFSDTAGSASAEGIGAKVAHSFYLSTLGSNLAPATKNLLQNYLTTMNTPGIGPQGLYRGLMGVGAEKGALAKMSQYVKDVASGVKSTVAFNKAFPEYVKDMGEASTIVESMLAGDVAREGYTKMMGVRNVWDKIKTGMLTPFSTSEGFNRIVGYYAGRNSHIFHNATQLAKASGPAREAIMSEAGRVGQSLTMASHFTGGPLGIPKALINMWAPWRQFMHFPMRYAGFLHGSLRMGVDPNKLDWGTIGRSLAGSTAAYIGARNILGVDMSSGLMAGALPVPQYEKAPFYPFPLVPPVLSTAGELIRAVGTGSTEKLGSAASMLVPGGIAARKAYRTLAPRFAGYKQRTAEGRIPVYNDKGSLVGSYSPLQLSLQAMGLKPEGISAEQGAAQWLMSQRERIRTFRRDWLQALTANDITKANQINKEFQRVYPELGPMQVKKSDIRAIDNRRQISRLHRIEKGLPAAYRPIFQQVIGEASLGRITADVEGGSSAVLESYLPQR
jgi:hypothetical protein